MDETWLDAAGEGLIDRNRHSFQSKT